jgi:hypothetical protein
MPADRRSKFKPAHLLACVALLAATAAHSTEGAPYFYTWGFGSNAYKANSLAAARNAGVTAVTLAFGVSGGGCTLGGGLDIIMNDPGTRSDVQPLIVKLVRRARRIHPGSPELSSYAQANL